MPATRLALAVALCFPAVAALAQTAPCPARAEADLAAALPGNWLLTLGAGTQTVSGGSGSPLEAVADPVSATVTGEGGQAVMTSPEFGEAGLYFALPSQDAPLGSTDADGGFVFVANVGSDCDPAGLPRLIGGAQGADGSELALDLYAFGPDSYAGSMSYRQGESVWVRSVTLTR